jgi:hypothetical protein
MGVSFSVVFEADVPQYGIIGNDTLLAERKEELHQVASDNGLTSLDAFESYDPADAAEFLDEDELAGLPSVQWFEAADGLNAVRSLLAHLKEHPDALLDPDAILADLATIESNLSVAERAGVRFRFAVVP